MSQMGLMNYFYPLMSLVTDVIGVASDGLIAPRIAQNVPDAMPAGSIVFMKRLGRSQSMKREPSRILLDLLASHLRQGKNKGT